MVKLRLTRMGRKKRPYYRIIAIDSRRPRDGAFIDNLGYYHPMTDPPTIVVHAEKTLKWLRVGAQPSDTVLSLLRRQGVWLRWRLEKRGKSEEQINEAMTEWFATHAPSQPEVAVEVAEKPVEAKPDIKATTEEVVEAKIEATVAPEPAKEEVQPVVKAEPKPAKVEEKPAAKVDAKPAKVEEEPAVKAEPKPVAADPKIDAKATTESTDAEKTESSESSTEAKTEEATD